MRYAPVLIFPGILYEHCTCMHILKVHISPNFHVIYLPNGRYHVKNCEDLFRRIFYALQNHSYSFFTQKQREARYVQKKKSKNRWLVYYGSVQKVFFFVFFIPEVRLMNKTEVDTVERFEVQGAFP